ncbi:hypothetical protein DYB28_014597 [Aphanomyces astaci]|uniref:Uncharacterized protein n=1 Tax=Aphanomyces astaci TaxID=112090 RepID=A0A397D724_APHAT|nr:hypothetical protein DYB30_008567 [Aphanomyces astaci]RHZ38504.1 hypothetical protein DYB26_006098 [Aphanomyces astaci]RLO02210.1 hypothetical protein DYB28_014597 [Aphanomyces astaci]
MNRPLLFALLLTAIFATTTTAWTCNSTKIVNWMNSCDKLGSDDEKCKNRACHSALHYLVEGFVRDCYVQSGLGPASELDKYIDLDNYCHGETPAPKPVPTTTTPVPTTTTPVPTTTTPVPTTSTPKPFPTTTTALKWCNTTKVANWMNSCDKLGSNDEKCKNRACHSALHYIVDKIVRDCYVQSGMGPVSDLDKYIVLSNYCHNQPPAPKPVRTTTTPVPTTTTVAPTTVVPTIAPTSTPVACGTVE